MADALEVLTIADRALLLALRAWGDAADPRFWAGFGPGWRERLRTAYETTAHRTPAEALDQLRRENEAEARPDLTRVHPSWWVRALKEETPAVRRVVVAGTPPALRHALQAGLGLTDADLATDRAPVADAARCAVALWTERLVGDLAVRDDDPPVVVAMTRFDLRDLTRLIQTTGLVKWALSWEAPPGLKPRDRERFDHIRARFGEPSPRHKQLARHDVVRHGPTGRHEVGRLGLVTFARLLEVVEPYRVRWALQHLPYPFAKFTRSLMKPKRDSSLVPWEAEILDAAWDRLRAEGRFADQRGETP